MDLARRTFLKSLGCATAAATLPSPLVARGSGHSAADHGDSVGVLVDIPNCIGCRRCEYACQDAAGFGPPPLESFEDKSVFSEHRRPGPRTYTTINQFPGADGSAGPAYVKANCLHCNEPACASACLVRALEKQENGAVTYNPSRCMGCRYCMVACPFQIPTFDYDNPLTPQVRKCTFCFGRISKNGNGNGNGNGTVPACVKICPNDALIYGRRKDLLAVAHEKIAARPDVYVDHVYGEHEAGGTAWMYISGVPFEKLQLPALGEPPSRTTETIQHAIFKYFMPPLTLYALLGVIMRLSRPEGKMPHGVAAPVDEARDAADGNGRTATTVGDPPERVAERGAREAVRQ